MEGVMSLALLHSPADVLRHLLIVKGLGANPDQFQTVTWPIYAASEPDRPDDCVTVFDTAGLDQGRSMIDGESWGPKGFQVRIRSLDHQTGWVKAYAILRSMAESIYQETVTIGAAVYQVWDIVGMSEVIPIGREIGKSKRHVFTINGMIHVERQS
jgi:hypothetical protein